MAVKGQELHLKIQGKDSLQTARIDSVGYVKMHASLKSLSREIDSVFLQVQKMGFLDVRTFPLKKINDSLYLAKFHLGKEYKVLKIYYHELPIEKKTLKKASLDFNADYFTVPLNKVETVLGFMNQHIANRGRPFSFLQLKNIRKGTKGELTADLKSAVSKPRTVDEIVIKGYEKFPSSFVKHFIGIRLGRPFSKKRLEEKIKRLENLPFASPIRPPQVQFTKDSTAIYLYLEKEKSNSFDGFLGFSNNEEDSKLQLTGNVNLILLNNLNYGESLRLQYKSDGEEQIRFQAVLDLPYLFQTPVGTNLGLEIFKKDSSYITIDQQAKITYQLNSRIKTFVGYRYSTSNNLLEEGEQISGSVIEDYTANYIELGGSYTDFNQDSDLFPVKANLEIGLSYGNREISSTPTEQWIGTVGAGYIFQLNSRNSLYLHNESSVIISDNYLTNELFRFGGINSIRGFEENSISASLFSVVQTEYRYLLSQNLYAHTIIDYAYYENKLLDLRENLYGIGFGLGLKTGAGILRVNFANGKADGQNFDFQNTKIHLSLTAKF